MGERAAIERIASLAAISPHSRAPAHGDPGQREHAAGIHDGAPIRALKKPATATKSSP
jgi:hypothetical protein